MKRAATSGESGAGETDWSSISWLRSLDFAAVVWAALPERFGRFDYLTYSLKHEELRAILHSKGLQSLDNCIWSGIQQLREVEATNRKRQKQEVPITGAELTNKFASADLFRRAGSKSWRAPRQRPPQHGARAQGIGRLTGRVHDPQLSCTHDAFNRVGLCDCPRNPRRAVSN